MGSVPPRLIETPTAGKSASLTFRLVLRATQPITMSKMFLVASAMPTPGKLHLPFKAGLWYTWRMKNFKSIAARLMCLFVLAFAGYSRVDDVVGVINDLFL